MQKQNGEFIMFIMNNIRAFFSAALPWLTMGIVIAIFAARGASREKGNVKEEDNYSTEGMCLGMSFGVCLGTLFNSVGIGISLGMLVGLAIGSCLRKNQRGNTK